MIVPMKKISVIVLENRRRESLRALRKAGVMHITDTSGRSQTCDDLATQRERLEEVMTKLIDVRSSYKKEHVPSAELTQVLEPDEFAEVHARALYLIEQEKEKSENIQKLRLQYDRLSVWGDFNPEDITELRASHIHLDFMLIHHKELAKMSEDINYIVLRKIGKLSLVAAIDCEHREIAGAQWLELPQYSLSRIHTMISEMENQLDAHLRELLELSAYIPHYKRQLAALSQNLKFESIYASMDTMDRVAWISGYIPHDKLSVFTQTAQEQSWAYAVDDPGEEDEPPTLIRNKRWVSIISVVFDIMGTVPGYREFDISMWFLMFFSLFFAMIIGDAAYGLIFLGLGLFVHRKTRKASNAVVLIYVLSIATIVWGALTGTWFGSKAVLEALPFLQKLVVPNLANYPELFGVDSTSAQNTVMKFCFIIGTLQLSLACTMNIIRKLPKKNLSAVADFGWLIMIDALYFLVLMLVTNQAIATQVVATVVGIGFALVVMFGAQSPGVPFVKGLLKGVGGLFTTFLNSISAFSNIISYIRLFAVGMASLAIAQSFNNMASGMLQGFAIPAGVLVLVIGHGLNLVMGVLSVVVHGVRLNLLEFSGQLGMEWTGVVYDPFRETIEAS